MNSIPFNRPYMTGKEIAYLQEAHGNNRLAGDGLFSKRCQEWLEKQVGTHRALLTHSCTAALEMAALLLDIKPGDEIIMPSYTFVSTANAFALRGGVPVFVDIREDTLNIDERLIEAAITPRTRAIVVVHYAGVACEMDAIMAIAQKHGLHVIEDAAQGAMANYKGQPLGSMGTFGAVSFHETKNIICGEGGALFVNDADFEPTAEIIREKGTDRSRFFRGEVDKYTWQHMGSSFLPGELTAAFLYAQMQEAENITKARLEIWNRYHALFASLEQQGLLRRPIIPNGCQHNGHMYYLLLPSETLRDEMIMQLKAANIQAVTHYVPLHSSPAGKRFGRAHGTFTHTDNLSARLLRLPFWIGLSEAQQEKIVSVLTKTLQSARATAA